jgi:serine/threonine protein kinase
MIGPAAKIKSFDLRPGLVLGGKYLVEAYLGGGLEGEVYRVLEARTRVRRAAKLFYPQENPRDQAARLYARKLDRLRGCPIVIQYHHAESLQIRGLRVTCLISEYVDGVMLADFVAAHPGRRLRPFEALHLIYPIVCGLEQMHRLKEYHGDLHEHNVLVRQRGIFFEVKCADFYPLGRYSSRRRQDDIVDLVRLLHWTVGGRRWYGRQPPAIKGICRGLRRDLILERFPRATQLRAYLESFPWLSVL